MMYQFLSSLCQIAWGSGLLFLLLGTGVFCLCSGKLAAARSLRYVWTKHEKRRKSDGISAFAASSASLAAAMGTGNLAGVATALTLGGAGAIFWMWAAALVGMSLIYAENFLGSRYRRRDAQGNPVRGAMAYLRYGLNSPKIAAAFALCCTAASFGMGNMTQSNAIAQTLAAAFSVPPVVSGIAAAVVTGAVISGGAKRIGKFTCAVMPLLSGAYLAAACVVIWQFRGNLGTAFSDIFDGAFGISAAGGGISGAAVRHALSVGLRRGVFSNEAGLGSSSLLHGEANEENPEKLGLFGMCEVFIDTFVCCTATALAILCTGALESSTDGAVLVLEAFRRGMGTAADFLLPPMIALFALCTLIGWSYCGSTAFGYLTKGRYIRSYRLIFCLAAGVGAVLRLDAVWMLADIANAGMAYCNLPALLLLYPAAVRNECETDRDGCSRRTNRHACTSGCGKPHSARGRA